MLLANTDEAKTHRHRWQVPADAATSQAVVKVVAWSNDLERGVATSAPFPITP